MIKKFFLQILLITGIVCFFGLNFNTKVSIKFWFNDLLTVNDISLFVALGFSYLLGIISFIPLYISKNIKNKIKRKKEIQDKTTVNVNE